MTLKEDVLDMFGKLDPHIIDKNLKMIRRIASEVGIDPVDFYEYTGHDLDPDFYDDRESDNYESALEHRQMNAMNHFCGKIF